MGMFMSNEFSFDTYQEAAHELRLGSAMNPDYARHGLTGEVGELASIYAKALRDGPKENHKEMVLKELGDILWFISAIAVDEGFYLSEVAATNIHKLRDRKERGVLRGSGDNR